MPGKSLEMKASEKFHELSDNYFNTPAPPEPELVSIPNPKKHPLGTDATQPFGIWCGAAKISNS